jgi:predicted NUDIX family phosphoesterase/thymidylate synthase ThyX
MVKEILVVERGLLFDDKHFQGFLPISERDFSATISKNYQYKERNDELEADSNFKQIIPYVWIVNPLTKQVFFYKRAVDSGYTEQRLKDKWSGGVGGHIDKEKTSDPIFVSMMRELKEEVKMDEYPVPKIIGFLNDDSNDVGKVHFGAIAIAETTRSVEKGSQEMAHGQFYSLEEIEKIFSDPNNIIEDWTKISWPPVKEHLANSGNSVFSDLDKSVLDVFVTSAEDPIYAIRSDVPPEVFGAFGSYFSRNPKDFRVHMLDAIKGQIDEGAMGFNDDSLKWLAEKDFRAPSEAIQKGIAKSQDFFKKWYGKYSHKSIANTVWIPMVGNNVSQLFIRELAYDQLAFFIEQSTRYVRFDSDNVYKDPDVMASEHSGAYMEAMKTLSKAYQKLTDIAIEHYTKQIPYENWLEAQIDKVKEMKDDLRKRKYEREIRGKAFDVSRFLLPQATKTNLAWILDARSTEFDVAAWKGHPLQEIRNSAVLIEKNAGQIAPSLLKYTEKNEYYSKKLNDYHGKIKTSDPKAFEKSVDIISYEENALDKVVAHILKRHGRGGTLRQRYEEAKAMSFNEKIRLLRDVVEGRGSHDEWISLEEDVDLVNIVIEIRSDIGAMRDWRRHQKWDRGDSRYTLDNGYYKPPMIMDMGQEAEEVFDKAMKVAHEAEKAIREDFPHQAQYVIPMAALTAMTMSAGLDQMQYMLWTRTTPEANFSYREDAFNLAEAVVKVHPWMLGYEKYPEGKTFLEIYEEAPLKGFLKLQVGDMSLHQ